MNKQLIFLSFLCLGIGIFVLPANITAKEPVKAAPKYKGDIIPITDPVQAKYKPVRINAKFIDFMDSDLDISIYGAVSIKDNRLQWDLQYKGGEIGDNVIDGRISTDYYGGMYSLEKPFQGHKEIPPDEMKQTKFVFFLSVNQFLNELNSHPVKAGERIYSSNGFLKQFGEFGDEELLITVKSFKMTAFLKGWVSENSKRVLLTEINGKGIWQDNTGFPLEIVVNGYSLIDPETFQVIDAEVIIIPKGDQTLDPIRVTYKADIQME